MKGDTIMIRSGICALVALAASVPVLDGQNQTVGLLLNSTAKNSPGCGWTPATFGEKRRPSGKIVSTYSPSSV